MCQTGSAGVSVNEIMYTATAVIPKPSPCSARGCTLSVNLPTIGARMIVINAIGTNSSAASNGE